MKGKNLEYRGETNGVHGWFSPQGETYYWHKSWQHIAEDEMGNRACNELPLEDNKDLTVEQIEDAISQHVEKKES